MGLNGLPSLVRPWFIEASPTVEKAVSCYKVDWLIVLLLSFRSVQSSLAQCKFRSAGKERCKWRHGWCYIAQSASEQLQLSGPTFGFTMREFSMVGSYTENPKKSQNCQNWGVGAYTGMGACSGQYGTEKLWNGSTVTEKKFTWWAVTWRTLKNHGTIKIGGWALAWKLVYNWDNTFHKIILFTVVNQYRYTLCL